MSIPHRYETLDYNKPERLVADILKVNKIRFKHGIAVDPEKGKEFIELPDGTLYVPDFFVLDHPKILIECKDFDIPGTLDDWENKWNGLRELGFHVLLVIPSDDQYFQAEGLCDAHLTYKELDRLPVMLIRLEGL